MGKADLHIHTRVSDGMATVEQLLRHVEEQTDLDVIAITDHEDAEGSFLARELATRRNLRFEVVTGAEVTTLQGHLLALFIERPVLSFRPLARTVAEVHRQGGICVIPHPLSWLTRSVGQRAIESLLAKGDPEIRVDAIERSLSPAARLTQAKMARLNEDAYGFPEVGSSDAHFLQAVAASYTDFPGRTAEDLKRAVLLHQTKPVHTRYPSFRELGAGALLYQTTRGLMATPRKMARAPIQRLRRVRT